MNTHTINKIAIRLFLGSALSVTLNFALASPAQIPAPAPLSLGATSVLPNIMLMIDNSGSMGDNKVPDAPTGMPANTTTSCSTPIAAGGTTANAATTVYAQKSSSSNTVVLCTSNSLCGTGNNFPITSKCFTPDQYYEVKYFQGTSVIADLGGGPFTGNQLNWYFSSVHTFSSTTNLVANTTNSSPDRMTIARDAAKNLVSSLDPTKQGNKTVIRIGLSTYNNGQGGKLLIPMTDLTTAQVTTTNTAIGNLSAGGNTPLATTLAGIGKYFAMGETGNLTLHPLDTTAVSACNVGTAASPLYPHKNCTASVSNIFSNTFNSTTVNDLLNAGSTNPITNYCQKNAVILISDGLPNGDREISPYLRDYTGDCAKGLCNADQSTASLPGANTNVPLTATGTGCHDAVAEKRKNGVITTPASPADWYNIACQNGTKAGRVYESEGSDYLDDVALALYQMDLRPSSWTAIKGGMISNIQTYTIGIADNTIDWKSSVLKDAGDNSGGFFTYAADYNSLTAALIKAVNDARKGVGSFSAIVANATSFQANSSALFQAKYDTADWTGSFLMLPLALDANNALQPQASVWDAATLIPAWNSTAKTSPRNIFTFNSAATPKGVAFKDLAGSVICQKLTSTQQSALGVTNCTNTADTGVWLLDWLRGDISHEVINTTQKTYNATSNPQDPRDIASYNATTPPKNNIFRNRARFYSAAVGSHKKGDLIPPDPWLLGDIVNSDAAYVGNQDYGYSNTKFTGVGGGTAYSDYVASKATWRPMVYIGANDGMLHGFDAQLPANSTTAGKEIIAYMPNMVFNGGWLSNFPLPTYNHQYSVDGSPRVSDVNFSTTTIADWRTVLVGTSGAGGKAVFALDVSNPDSFSGNNVLWEVSDIDTPNTTDKTDLAANMGYTLPQPAIGKLPNGSWVAIVANGYASKNGHAVLYILDIKTGAVIKKFDTGSGDNSNNFNGLSTPFAADINADGVIEAIYAGDLLGNMWKFDVSSPESTNNNSANSYAQWKIAYGTTAAPAPLFIACTDPTSTTTCSNTRQPITNKPQVGKVGSAQSATGGLMIYFGTGKYFETTDNDTIGQTQSFYGVWDQCPAVYPASTNTTATATCTTTIPKSNLLAQTVVEEQMVAPSTVKNVRVTSNTAISYPTQKGWYMDFIDPSAAINASLTTTPKKPNVGERIVSASLLRGGRIVFATLIPIKVADATQDTCTPGANSTSWLMELDAISGSSLSTPALDINNSGTVDTTGNTDKVLVAGSYTPASGLKMENGSTKTPAVMSNPAGGNEIKFTGSSSGSTPKGIAEVTPITSITGAQRQSWNQIIPPQ